jgi:hypothetical protein
MDKKTNKESVENKRLQVKTNIKAGPNRRAHDHIGNFNFKVEIEGVTTR